MADQLNSLVAIRFLNRVLNKIFKNKLYNILFQSQLREAFLQQLLQGYSNYDRQLRLIYRN